MDAFKLLSRSTSLQKSRPQSEAQKPHLPSAGVSVHLQPLADDDLSSNSGTESRGKKRKRGSDGVASKSKTGEGAAGETKDDPAQDEEERRRILKKHKLKVTLLEGSAKRESKSAKGETKSQRKKQKNASIYPRPLATFKELQTRCHVSQRLMDNLGEQGFYTPTEVQMAALPILLGSNSDKGLGEKRKKSGHSPQPDLLTVAPTGSGKTLAFLVPVIQRLLDTQHSENPEDGSKSRYVRALILAPTHELVDQIVNEGKKLCTGTGIKVASMRKGSHVAQASSAPSPEHQSTIKADILVSTPMTLVNELGRSEGANSSLDSIIQLVLDEADVLLDPLFREQTMAIWSACSNVDLRVSLWSATIGASIETMAQEHITARRKELHVKRSPPMFRLIVGLKDSSLPTIAHRLIYAATEQGKLLALRELLHPSTATSTDSSAALRPPFIVFTQTIQRAQALFSELLYDIPPEAGGSQRIAVLHSELSESARSSVMAGFRKGEIWIIITTDLLSRGVDFRGVNGVVNYDIPNTGASYVHRAGRTGRAGREGGVAVTLYTKEDVPYVKNIANVIAASEKVHGRAPQQGQPALDQWLLDSLPKVSKQAKKDLKKRGVAVRRTVQKDKDTPKEVRRTRIGTKSGYDRKMENRRRGARQGQEQANEEQSSGDDDEWEGLDG